jgi:hypothetical protein
MWRLAACSIVLCAACSSSDGGGEAVPTKTSAIVSFETAAGCAQPIDFEYGSFEPVKYASNDTNDGVICQVREEPAGVGVSLLVQRDGGEWGLTVTGSLVNGKTDQPLKVITTRLGSPSTPIDRGACTANLVEPPGAGHVWIELSCPSNGGSICAMHGQLRFVACNR